MIKAIVFAYNDIGCAGFQALTEFGCKIQAVSSPRRFQ